MSNIATLRKTADVAAEVAALNTYSLKLREAQARRDAARHGLALQKSRVNGRYRVAARAGYSRRNTVPVYGDWCGRYTLTLDHVEDFLNHFVFM